MRTFLSFQFKPHFKPPAIFKCVKTWGCTFIHLPHKPGVRAFIQLTGQLFLTCERAKLFSLRTQKETDHLSSVIPSHNKVAAKENYIKTVYIPGRAPNHNLWVNVGKRAFLFNVTCECIHWIVFSFSKSARKCKGGVARMCCIHVHPQLAFQLIVMTSSLWLNADTWNLSSFPLTAVKKRRHLHKKWHKTTSARCNLPV